MQNFDTGLEDVVRRNVKRELPCKLTDEELLRVARQRATKEAEKAQLEADLAKEIKRRKDQIAELADEIQKQGRELHTGEQDRTVPCNEVFRRALDGTGWIHTIRMDTFDEVERRPATAHETQRYLPAVEGHGVGLLDQARTAQQLERSAQDEGDDVPGEDETTEDTAADADDDDGNEVADDAEQPAPKKRGGRGKRS